MGGRRGRRSVTLTCGGRGLERQQRPICYAAVLHPDGEGNGR